MRTETSSIDAAVKRPAISSVDIRVATMTIAMVIASRGGAWNAWRPVNAHFRRGRSGSFVATTPVMKAIAAQVGNAVRVSSAWEMCVGP
jgi:hypothetical protein